MQGLGDNRRSILDRSMKMLHFPSSIYQALKYLLLIEQMETTYFGLLHTYLLLISLKITTFLLLLSGNIGKVAELWV